MTRLPYRIYSDRINESMRSLMHNLGDIDFDHRVTLERIERDCENVELRKHLIGKAQADHQLKRQPYVDLLNELRIKQHRRSFVARR